LRFAGVRLAVLAGFTAMVIATSPASPTQFAWEALGGVWTLRAFLIGGAFLAVPFFAGERPVTARLLLVTGAAWLLGSRLVFEDFLLGGQMAVLGDVFPVMLALVSALLIGLPGGRTGRV
jgi:hypothetical protein